MAPRGSRNGGVMWGAVLRGLGGVVGRSRGVMVPLQVWLCHPLPRRAVAHHARVAVWPPERPGAPSAVLHVAGRERSWAGQDCRRWGAGVVVAGGVVRSCCGLGASAGGRRGCGRSGCISWVSLCVLLYVTLGQLRFTPSAGSKVSRHLRVPLAPGVRAWPML